MADYYSILKKTISGLPANTTETRKAVYAKARQAIDRQLRSMNPAPSEAMIERQMGQLEDAIERMESEFPVRTSAAPAARAASGAALPPLRPMVASGQGSAAASDAAAREAQIRQAQARQAEARQAEARQAEARLAEARLAQANKVQAPAARSSTQSPTLSGNARPASAEKREPMLDEPRQRTQARQGEKPAVERDAAPAYDSSLDELSDFGERNRARNGRNTRAVRSGGGSRILPYILAIVLLAALGAGAYALYLNREPLMALFNSASGGSEQTAANTGTEQDPAASGGQQPVREVNGGETTAANDQAGGDGGSDKEDVRLTEQGETVSGQPLDTASDSTTQPAFGENPAGLPQGQDESEEAQVNPVDEADGEATEDLSLEESGETETAENVAGKEQTQVQGQSDTAPAGPVIGQKAFLYEEGAQGAAATRDNAAIVWTLAKESPADGLPAEPVIKGLLDVPGRGLTMSLTIKRNVDEALPASHIIELLFSATPDFTGGNVDTVARFVMKASEQARGEGLVAVPAKIDAGYFLIALNNLPQALETNSKLMKESGWIDIPLGYTTGRRALITLEKGAIGEKVFSDAFAQWATLTR